MNTINKRQPFFEVSLSGLQAASSKQAEPAMPAVYVCLSAGVDNSKTEPRSCTHGERSAQRRLAKGLFLKKEIAAAITSLLQQGLLVDRAPADGVRKLRATTYEVSPDRTEDLLAVAHDFIGMQVFKDGKRRKRKLNPGVANLSGMLRTCSSLDTTISLDQSKTDMLQTFFCLLAKQDFKAHGGVDPRAVSGTFDDCKPGENPVHDSSLLSVGDGQVAHVRFAVAPEELVPSKKFAREVFGSIAREKSCKAKPEVRLAHAIEQLIRAELLYRVAVLWDGDPRRSEKAKPLATIAIRGSWLPQIDESTVRLETSMGEFSARKEIDKLLDAWGVLPKSQQYTGQGESVFAHSGIYRYVVPNKHLKRWVLLEQYRVRWWAATDDNLTGLSFDDHRTQNYLLMIAKIVGQGMGGY